MNVVINGDRQDISERTLAELCERYKAEPTTIATAVNGNFINVNDRAALALKEGDSIEILSPRQGG